MFICSYCFCKVEEPQLIADEPDLQKLSELRLKYQSLADLEEAEKNAEELCNQKLAALEAEEKKRRAEYRKREEALDEEEAAMEKRMAGLMTSPARVFQAGTYEGSECESDNESESEYEGDDEHEGCEEGGEEEEEIDRDSLVSCEDPDVEVTGNSDVESLGCYHGLIDSDVAEARLNITSG